MQKIMKKKMLRGISQTKIKNSKRKVHAADLILQYNNCNLKNSNNLKILTMQIYQKVQELQQNSMSGHQLKDNLIYPSIGKNVKLMKVNCKIDLKSPAYHYSSQQHPILQPIGMPHNQNLCFLSEITKNSARNQRRSNKSVYLPKALEQQDAGIYKNYLEMLKNNKIESYIKFSIPVHYQQKQKGLLFFVLQKLVEKQYKSFFYQFKKIRGKQYSLQDKQDDYKFNKDHKSRSYFTQYVNNLDDSPIKITYERVIINNQQQSQMCKKSSGVKHRQYHSSTNHPHSHNAYSSLSKKKYQKNKIEDQQNSTTNLIKDNKKDSYNQNQLYTIQRKRTQNRKSFHQQPTNNHKKQKKLSQVSNYKTTNMNEQDIQQTGRLYTKIKTSRNQGRKNCQNCKYCISKKNYAIVYKKGSQDIPY